LWSTLLAPPKSEAQATPLQAASPKTNRHATKKREGRVFWIACNPVSSGLAGSLP